MALPDYLKDTGKDLARQMTAAYTPELDTSKFMGSQFVAGQDRAQTQAYNLATAGVGSYQPYLDSAKAAQQQAAGTVGGLGALTGPMTGQQLTDYTSPYQGAVLDETLRQYDLSRQGGMQDIKDAAVASGNFGGGREGAMLGQYQGDTLANREGIRAGLLQQGYQGALDHRQQNLLKQSIPQYIDNIIWLDSLPKKKFNGLIIANEVLDALPVKRFKKESNLFKEVKVTSINNNFHWVDTLVCDELKFFLENTVLNIVLYFKITYF